MKISRLDRLWQGIAMLTASAALSLGTVFSFAGAYEVVYFARILAIVCGTASVLFTALAMTGETVNQGKPTLLRIAGIVALAGGLVFAKTIRYSAAETAGQLTATLADAYPFLKGLRVPFDNFSEADSTAILGLVGVGLAYLTVRALMGSARHETFLFLASLPPLAMDLIIVNRAPDPWALALTVFGLSWLFLSRTSRDHQAYGNAAWLLLPAAVLASGALLFSPDTYKVPEWRSSMRDRIADRIGFSGQEPNGSGAALQYAQTLGTRIWNESIGETDLSLLGPQEDTGVPVMDVFADRDVRCFLFGEASAVYENNTWKPLDESAYQRLYLQPTDWISEGYGSNNLILRTDRRSSVLYLPYGALLLPDGVWAHHDRYLENISGMKEYAFALSDGRSGFGSYRTYGTFAKDVYTRVPEETKAGLTEIVSGLRERVAEDSLDTEQTAALVADYVKTSAEYDLATPRVPSGKDFVQWFLLESDTGYCVHFATAATILLRCLDIPARYVTGYAVNAKGGVWTEVTEDDAHAWAEYYLDGFGWVPLETTASRNRVPGESAADPNGENAADPDAQETRNHPAEEETRQNDAGENGDADSEETGDDTGADSAWLGVRTVLQTLLGIASAALLLWQIAVRLIRHVRLHRGSNNRRALALYRYARTVCRLLPDAKAVRIGKALPEAILSAAEKARFSRHDVTVEELAAAVREADTLRKRLRTVKNPLKWLKIRLFYAL